MINDTQNWHALSADEVFEILESSHGGLAESEVQRRLEEYGPNEIEAEEQTPWWRILLDQIRNPLVLVLVVAAAIAFLVGETADAIAILVVIVINSTIGFLQEYRAEEAISALQRQAAPEAEVLRCHNGDRCEERRIAADQVVPGDVIVLEAGDQVPADARVFQLSNLEVDEAMLTGESQAVSKETEPLEEQLGVADRVNLVYGGTAVTQGRGRAVVVATGKRTEIGKIAGLIQETEKAESPLSRQLGDLSKLLGGLAIGMATVTLVVGLIRGFALDEMFLFALAAAVSAIPAGLPAVLTITLAVGVSRMAQRNAIIRRLEAVDTLGAATVICTDKTGTLTRNEMTVQQVWVGGRMVKVTGAGLEPEGDFVQDGEPVSVEGDDALRLALEIGTLCNNSRLSHHEMEAGDRWEIRGDPTEGALVVVAAKAGLRKETLDDRRERIDEIPFSSKSKFMATFHRVDGDEIDVYVKGAPETVVYLSTGVLWDGEAHDLTDDRRQAILDENEGMAANALRVLALAHQRISQSELEEVKDDLQHGRGRLTFVGLAGMIDPPRPEARPAVEQSQSAGIQVLMLTGDHRLTGGAIAREVGILDRDGDGQVITGAEIEDLTDDELDELMREAKAFARVSPEHKHRIVESLARNGHVAAMTGDGVNDAPALQASAIGVAMGITGTDVTKGTADMVLTDDNFASIVAAVEEGRAVFQNVRKVVKFLLATNAGEILTILAALILLPIEQTIFTPVQLLWVNLVTDGLLDVTIAMEPKEGDVMEDPPRKPDTPIVTRVMVQNMVFVAVFMAVGTLWSFVRLYPQAGLVYARTVTFVTLAMFQVFNSLNVRSRTKSVFELGFFTNPYLIAAIIVSVLLQVMATQVGFFQGILDTQPISLSDWGLIVLVSSSVFIAEEIRKRIAARRRR